MKNILTIFVLSIFISCGSKEEKKKGDIGKSLDKFASVFTIISSTLTTIILATKL